MVRPDWASLNGLWDYAIVDREAARPVQWDGKILVPFAVESALSGVGRPVGADKELWYRRELEVPRRWRGRRVLLHFGAVDWACEAWVNGRPVGGHRGGYDPFTFDITEALEPNGPQELVLRVLDATDESNSPQARGKQVTRPRSIFYTAVTGIWQTVWLEPVASTHIERLRITPDLDRGAFLFEPVIIGEAADAVLEISVNRNGKSVASASGAASAGLVVEIPDPEPWSPDDPALYDVRAVLKKGGRALDTLTSYAGLRKISVEPDGSGVLRLFLNGRPLFQFGPLDQGWWPDGLYTAPTDEALRYDLEVIRSLGMNMLRKHVKVEPQRLYTWCDRMGLLVWQDMPSALYDRKAYAAGELAPIDAQWEAEWRSIMDALHNHPSIVMWVPFNEGWGQFDTERITALTKERDPSRLVNNASGWTDKGVGDIIDIHSYPGPAIPPLEAGRAAVLGEFGGLGLPVSGHLWQSEGNWGYRNLDDLKTFEERYTELIKDLAPLVDKGLAAAVYTQTTDCEIEVNGLMTYDRAVVKLDPPRFAPFHRQYLPLGKASRKAGRAGR
jgi:beta-galactosidase/beta-glucuronidase